MRIRPSAVVVFAAAILLSSAARATAAPTLIVVGGELLGAQNVNVGGTLYDVTFVDTTCVLAFSGCDSSSDFDFDSTSAFVAGAALRDQVFGSGDSFDMNPELTFGCSTTTECQIWIPHTVPSAGDFLAAVTHNFEDALGDTVGSGSSPASWTFGTVSHQVLADFTPTAVPEPTSLLLFGTGAAALAAKVTWRKKQQQQVR